MEPLLAAVSHRPPSTGPARNPSPFTKVTHAAVQGALRKSLRGERLTFEDGVNLFHAPDLVELGAVADEVNRRRNGRDVFFNVNRHINPTNVCALSCKFCAFSRKPGEPGAYAYTDEELIARAQAAASSGATEIHMVGGLHPRWNLDHYVHIIRTVKQAAPGCHVKAFTAVELDWLSRRARKPVNDILALLRDAGLGSMPGGGAEIFAPYVRESICDTKLTAEGWIDIHRTAHRLGLRSNCTMLYGHVEDVDSRVDHMLRLRALQDETGGFQVFIPLAFQPENNDLGITKHTYGVDDLKTIAISRLVLDNFANIKAYWIMMGNHMAQSALHFGANDVDGTVVEEKIANMAGSRNGMLTPKARLLRLIRAADRVPVERSTTYEPIRRYDDPTFDEAPVPSNASNVSAATPFDAHSVNTSATSVAPASQGAAVNA